MNLNYIDLLKNRLKDIAIILAELEFEIILNSNDIKRKKAVEYKYDLYCDRYEEVKNILQKFMM